MAQQNVIVMLSTAPSLRYFAFLSRLLSANTTLRPVLFGSEEQIRACKALGLTDAWVLQPASGIVEPISPSEPTDRDSEAASRGRRTGLKRVVKAIADKTDRWFLSRIVFGVVNVLRLRRQAKRILRAVKPVAVFVWGDNAGLGSGDFLRLCNLAGVKVYHCPVSLSQQEIIAELRISHRWQIASGSEVGILTRLIARFFPRQVLPYKGKHLFYHTRDEIITMVLTGCLTPDPWVLGMSRADRVMLATEWEKAYWMRRGLTEDKVEVVGYYELDVIRAARVRQDRHDGTSNTIVYSVPNFAEHNMYSWEKHWETIEDDLSALATTGCRLVLALHPKSDRGKYEWLQEKYGGTITRRPTAETLLECDLFVSIGSTTALWAASLGIRVIELAKMHGLVLPVLDMVPRITMISSEQELRDVLRGAFHAGRRLREDDWYVDQTAQLRFFRSESSADVVLRTLRRDLSLAPRGHMAPVSVVAATT
jgi:hypothetical protein